ncbi:MAG: hypothetical protein C0394_11475 [Syntrophus sp. (in: bacteria)]|nr:hypothetical protein [Syntrophus sp. (in: bacteria)]
MNGKHWIIGILAMVTWMAFTAASVGQDSHKHHGAASAVKERVFQAKISAPVEIAPGQSFSAVINIQDDKGQAVTDFDIFQEKLMHLILVRDDLAFFSHLHPEYQGKGKFRMDASLPSPGDYTLFCDYLPTGAREQISVLKLRGKGTPPSADRPDAGVTEKRVGDTKVEVSFSPKTVKANQNVAIAFDLKQAASDRPVQGLMPYLGEKGHLVILRKSSPLSAEDYIHAHATKEGGNSQIRFMARFPEAGLYKLWCQFDLGGNVRTADFWIRVE